MTDLAALSRNPELLRRAAVTLAAVAVYWIGCWIPMPGVDISALIGPSSTHNTAITRLSIMALGITPLLSAYILLEMLMIAFPALRGWAAAEPERRRTLTGWATVVALLLAMLQASGIASALEQIHGLVANPGPAFRVGAVASLVAATGLLIWLASVVTRHGIGQGFWLLVALPYAGSFIQALIVQGSLWGPASLISIPVSIGFLGIVTAVLVWLTQTSPPLADAEELPWAAVLGFAAAGWLLLVPILLMSLAGASGEDLDAVYGGRAIVLLPILTVPLLFILRRRSFGTKYSLAAPLALAALVAVGTALAYLPAQPLFPTPAIVLTLAAAGVMVVTGLRETLRPAATEPSP
jgi:preprotein translocase subunit SecY